MAEDLPVPAWKPTRQPARTRPQLSRELIVETALRLVDADGLDGVSMRRVAEELGTGPASLYAHVANKEELLDLVHDRVMGEVPVPPPDPERWQEQLREVALRAFQVYASHRDISRVSLANVPTGPNALRLAEGMMALMLAGRVPPLVAAYAIDRLALYIAADAYEGTLFYKRRVEAGQSHEEFTEAYFDSVRSFFTSLPPDRFPLLSKHVDALMSGDSAQRFEFGLDMLIRSLATYVETDAAVDTDAAVETDEGDTAGGTDR
ncbi:TetR/AcrR family transcriptional regulator [Rugosimonospora africana]|nr:TetR/AcrR family transcriptional regulator C-terminal domain-containing protein [Rugosimonospora africana]